MSNQMASQRDLPENLKTVLEAEPVDFAFLFGSQASGRITPMSDLDIAVQFSQSVKNKFKALLNLYPKIEKLVGLQKHIDIVDVGNASPSLKYNIAREGKLLFCKNELAFSIFKTRACLDYFDIAPTLNIIHQMTLDQIRQSYEKRHHGQRIIFKTH